ncbi:hypothetical protein HOK51_07695 [Candidatus Woesearchaeota archaeon]|jgi:hypothetical protein|nr:hypothetical protein [Candidatus Woesearchaeota archaeon]MBT6519707.1 hypothetical protein [Candidatus Woesearchaeota archaeon]MBT7368087.1 hypothetical protein [Candidatus Woesearchaeota archaeon]
MNQKLSLKKLQGIKPKGVKPKGSSALEKLLAFEKKYVEEFEGHKVLIDYAGYIPHGSVPDYANFRELYSDLYRMVEKDTNKMDFNNNLLESYIESSLILEESSEEEIYSDYKVIRGLFSATLLQLLTFQNEKENKPTKFHIDGKGKTFDYLFAGCRFVDELIVENFKGEGICSYLGSFGSINSFTAVNINGVYALNELGMNAKDIGSVILTNIQGEYSAYTLLNNAENIESFLAFDIQSDNVLFAIGSDSNFGFVYLDDIYGHETTLSAAFNRTSIKTLFIDSIENESFEEEGDIDSFNHSQVDLTIFYHDDDEAVEEKIEELFRTKTWNNLLSYARNPELLDKTVEQTGYSKLKNLLYELKKGEDTQTTISEIRNIAKPIDSPIK